jgi:uncharacterized protein (TIGR00369 family)
MLSPGRQARTFFVGGWTIMNTMPEGFDQASRWNQPLKFPLGDFLGITFVSQGNGNAIAQLQAQARYANPMGTLHGGILCDLADAAMGVAFATTLGPGESFTTLELKINFLRPVWTGLLRAEADVISRGRTVGMVNCRITDESNRLVASSTSTCMVLTGEAAKNR